MKAARQISSKTILEDRNCQCKKHMAKKKLFRSNINKKNCQTYPLLLDLIHSMENFHYELEEVLLMIHQHHYGKRKVNPFYWPGIEKKIDKNLVFIGISNKLLGLKLRRINHQSKI